MDPCKVCGGMDANLVDGFYYCVECGTQDVNVQETIVEQTAMADGTFAHATVKKFTVAAQDGIEMSGEWHKWHVFNFILAGLTDELISLGAKPSIKMKVLWVWSRYIKYFQVKDASETENKLDINDDADDILKNMTDGEDEDSSNEDSGGESKDNSKKSKSETFARDIRIMSKGTLLAILYVALNLDRSDIQLSHLLRFIKEDRLSLHKFMKYVPKELNITIIKNWKSFVLCHANFNPITIRALAMTCFKRLKLGLPLVPKLRKLVSNYVQELCLPGDLNNLVISLMHHIPIDFLDIDTLAQINLVRIPDYEGVCMSYILVALKMCLGLDDDYELRLSEMVEKVNDDENYLKSYKFGMFSAPCDRLFSFKEWCEHLQFRKSMLCKYFLSMSREFSAIPDDYVFMEQLEKRSERDIKLSDDVTMDILNKIQVGKDEQEGKSQVIPKEEFRATLTPMTSYIEVIAQYVQDPDIKLLLCEDFTQYSLKYAIEDLKLPSWSNDTENPIVGVNELGKVFNNYVIGTLNVKEGDTSLIYVRDCQNKNWLKTKPPGVDHITKSNQNENNSDKESDHGYDSNVENSISESLMTHVTINDESTYPDDKKLDIFEKLEGTKPIFDDNFKDIPLLFSNDNHTSIKEEIVDNFWEIDTQNNRAQESNTHSFNNIENQENGEISSIQFNPSTCDREKMITDLLEFARKTYKIPPPKNNTLKEPRKRKHKLINDETSSSEPKRKRTGVRAKKGEAKDAVNKLICAYFNNLQKDAINIVSEHVKSFIENVNNPTDIDTANYLDNTNELNDLDHQTEVNDSTILNSVENEASSTDMITNKSNNDVERDQNGMNSNDQNPDNVILNDTIENEIDDEILKSHPNFDEKKHDIKQLYLQLDEDLVEPDLNFNLKDNPEIDKILQRKIEEHLNNKFANSKNQTEDNIGDSTDEDDSDDDLPLRILKDTITIEQEKKDRRKETLDPLIPNLLNIKEFKYWVRHYKSRCVERSTDIAKKFDLELNENLPISFVIVIRECSALLGCSMFSIYKNMQNIETLLIT